MKRLTNNYELRLSSEKCEFKVGNSSKDISSIKIEIPEMNTFSIQKNALINFLNSIKPVSKSSEICLEFNNELQKIIESIKKEKSYTLNYFITSPIYLNITAIEFEYVLGDNGIIQNLK